MTADSEAQLVSFGARLTELARERGDQHAIVIANPDRTEARCSYAELERWANLMAREFSARKVGQGDIVAVVAPLGREHLATVLGAWKVGATVLPLNAKAPDGELQRLFQVARPRVCVGERHGNVGIEQLSTADVRELIAHGDAPQLPDVVAARPMVFGSGGSTGIPKLINSFGSGASERGKALPGSSHFHRRTMIGSPPYHAMGFVITYLGLLDGHQLTVMGKFDAAHFLDLVEQERPTAVVVAPTMMQRMLQVPDVGERDLSSIEILTHAGSGCPQWVKRGWIDLIGATQVVESYTASEQVGSASIRGDEWLLKPGSVGRPSRCDIKILADDGVELPPGDVGEVYMRRHGVTGPAYEYVGRERGPVTSDGFASVGDLGYMDEDGYLYIVDRRADMIVTGGANVFPAEVEVVIGAVPNVADVAVVGIDDADWGRSVHAVVQLIADDVDETEMRERIVRACRENLAPYKIPKSVTFTETLPRNDAGKLRRSSVAEQLAQNLLGRPH